jgi:hypothetical protein
VLHPTQLGPGSWSVIIRRKGIDSTGYVRLERSFTCVVTAAPKPDEDPPPKPPSKPASRPKIAVMDERSGRSVTLHVTGEDFLPDQPPTPQGITVRVVDAVNVQDWAMLPTGSDEADAPSWTSVLSTSIVSSATPSA